MSSLIIQNLHPVIHAFFATPFTWFLTALGASVVFLKKDPSQKTFDIMLGFAAGVMIAASFWSLLAPSIEMSEKMGLPSWFPAAVGFIAGGLFLRLIAGIFILLSLGLAELHSKYWLFFTAFVGLNLLQSGVTNWCPMISILKACGVKEGSAPAKPTNSK